MRLIFCLFLLLFFNNCSLNKDSQYWTEDSIKNKGEQKKLSKTSKCSRYNKSLDMYLVPRIHDFAWRTQEIFCIVFGLRNS